MLQHIYDTIDPIAFRIGSIPVYWYGVLFVCSFFLAGVLIYRVAKHWELDFSTDDALSLIVAAIIGAVVGARIAYVVFYGDGYYWSHPGKILALNEGGLSFHGGLVGGLIAGYILSRIIRMPFLSIMDIALVCAPVGLGLVRCANFINGELWGAPTDLPWAVVFGGSAGEIPRHPTQLYEAFLEGVVLLCVQLIAAWKLPPRPRGTFTGLFMTCYGCFRILVENLRMPDAQVGYLFGTDWVTMGMTLSLPLVLVGIALLIYAHRRQMPQQGHGRVVFSS